MRFAFCICREPLVMDRTERIKRLSKFRDLIHENVR
jgi:hypothetical protein